MEGFHNWPLVWSLDYSYVYSSIDQIPYTNNHQTVSDMVNGLKSIISAEERLNFTTTIHGLDCLDTGQILLDNLSYPIERNAFHQLATKFSLALAGHAPRGMAGYLTTSPPDLRSMNWRYWQTFLSQSNINPTEVVLRTRKTHDQRAIFATVTPSYSVCDCDYFASIVEEVLTDSDYKGTGYYDGANFSMKISCDNPNIAERNWQSALHLYTSDDGGGSIHIRHAIYNAYHDAYVILPKHFAPNARKVHRGSQDLMADAIYTVVDQTEEVRAKFMPLLNAAAGDQVAQTSDNMRDIFTRLTATKMRVQQKMQIVKPVLNATGISQEVLAEKLFQNWNGNFTRFGVLKTVLQTSRKIPEPARSDLEYQCMAILDPHLQLRP